MPTPPSSGAASAPPPRKPEQRVLARAVGVWWVERLLEAARARRSREEGDLPPGEPAPR